jgi:pimeloyl-ACP methyl ester carboxylesterase
MATNPITWRTGTVASGGEDIYWEATAPADTADALVLCHGLGGNHASWFQQVAHFSASFRVVTWDQRGFGRSTRRTGEIGPRPAVGDLVAVLDSLGIERAHVVGQSMGGWCALGLALSSPERVRSLVLCDTLGGISTPEISDLLVRTARFEAPPDPPLAGVHPAIEGLDQRDFALAVLYQQLTSFGPAPDTAEVAGHLMTTTWEPQAVAALALPVLFLVGERDQLFPPPVIEAVAALVPDAEYAVVPGAAHSPYFEDATAWNELVASFLSRVE